MKRDDDTECNTHQHILTNWILNGPNCTNLSLNVLGVYINYCITNKSTPISFDGKAFHSANGGDKDLEFLEKISKVHLEFIQKEETQVPLFNYY